MTNREHLEVSGLTAGWPQKPVATGLDCGLHSGEIIVIAGPNGAGKSTILKTMARQLPPLAGSLKLDDTDIHRLTPRQFAAKVAYVPQTVEPGQDMTVEELVSLGRNPHQQWWSWSASENDHQAVENALQRTGTSGLRKRYLSNLSGGERQRASIALALAQQPVLMLLDEPTAHLDFKHQLELVELLIDLARHDIGIALVLHDLNLMARLADRILLLQKNDDAPSTVTAFGATSDVLTRENLKRAYSVNVTIVASPDNEAIYLPVSSA